MRERVRSLRDRWRRLLDYDTAALVAVRRWHEPRLTALMRGLTRLGDTRSWIILVLAIAALGDGLVEVALRLGLGAALGALAAQVPKRLLRRHRPNRKIPGFFALVDDPDAFSFPSGHTAAAFAAAVALMESSAGGGTPALVLAALIGVSRVYLGAHYPLDVAAGAMLGVAAGLLACALL